MYIIKYNYNTGDSEGTDYNIEKTLELQFESLEVAKDNLRRIKEHYLFYQEIRGYSNKFRKPEEILKEAQSKDWAQIKTGNIKNYNFCLVLKSDSGEPFQLCAPWCGYFESLNEAWIEKDVVEDDDMRISFR